MNKLPQDFSTGPGLLEFNPIEIIPMQQNAAEDVALSEQASSDNTVTEQPADNAPSKVDTAIQTHMNVMPFFAGGMLILLVAALVMRPGSGKRKAIGNKTVGSAKLLIKNGEHEAAIDMLNDHLIDNPGDDRAKALLRRATSAD